MAYTNQTEHILLLGASGATGLTFIKHQLSLPDSSLKPYLTLYIRSAARTKLASVLPVPTEQSSESTVLATHKIRIVEGSLTDSDKVVTALSSSGTFPLVTAVISLLGAYISPYYFITRSKPTPITDALTSVFLPAMSNLGINRILVLSTPSAFPVPSEAANMSWGWWFSNLIPKIVVPQGSAEMEGIAKAVLKQGVSEATTSQPGLRATVFRVPFLTNVEGSWTKEVRAFVLGGAGNTENKTLTRESLVVWLLEEVEKGRWVDKAPVLANLSQ